MNTGIQILNEIEKIVMNDKALESLRSQGVIMQELEEIFLKC